MKRYNRLYQFITQFTVESGTNAIKDHSKQNQAHYERVRQRFVNTLGQPKLEHDIVCADCASELIDRLLRYHVDENTVVVTTNFEHPNVDRFINNRSVATIHLTRDQIRYNQFDEIEKLDKSKKVVCYIIGTSYYDGVTNAQENLVALKRTLSRFERSVLILDDCQGMFIVPRDYSIFDYVINTGHSLCKAYNLGMCLVKQGNDKVGFEWSKCVEQYLDRLAMTKKSFDVAFPMFKDVMFETFRYCIDNRIFNVIDNTAPNVFSVKISDLKYIGELKESSSIKLYTNDRGEHILRMRGQDILCEDASYQILENLVDHAKRLKLRMEMQL